MAIILEVIVYAVLFSYLLSALLYIGGSKTNNDKVLKSALILAIGDVFSI